jgi:AcrR family transcriptional regulator
MARQSRQALIQATLRSITNDGYSGASIERITAIAGVSRGLIRHYFRSKDELLTEAYRFLGDQLRDQLKAVSSTRRPDALSQMRALVDVIFEPPIFEIDVLCAWYALRDVARTEAPLKKVNREIYGWYRDYIRDLFAKAARETSVKIDVNKAADGLVALSDGLWLELTVEPLAFKTSYAKAICHDYVDRILKVAD